MHVTCWCCAGHCFWTHPNLVRRTAGNMLSCELRDACANQPTFGHVFSKSSIGQNRQFGVVCCLWCCALTFHIIHTTPCRQALLLDRYTLQACSTRDHPASTNAAGCACVRCRVPPFLSPSGSPHPRHCPIAPLFQTLVRTLLCTPGTTRTNFAEVQSWHCWDRHCALRKSPLHHTCLVRTPSDA